MDVLVRLYCLGTNEKGECAHAQCRHNFLPWLFSICRWWNPWTRKPWIHRAGCVSGASPAKRTNLQDGMGRDGLHNKGLWCGVERMLNSLAQLQSHPPSSQLFSTLRARKWQLHHPRSFPARGLWHSSSLHAMEASFPEWKDQAPQGEGLEVSQLLPSWTDLGRGHLALAQHSGAKMQGTLHSTESAPGWWLLTASLHTDQHHLPEPLWQLLLYISTNTILTDQPKQERHSLSVIVIKCII